MKRKAAILALVLVVVLTLAVALTACNGVKNTAKLTEGLEATVTRTVVNDDLSGIIASDITSAAINNYGVVTWSDNDTYAGTTYYYLPLGSSSVITNDAQFIPVGGGIYRTGNSTDGYSYYDANGYLRDSDTSATYNSGGQLTFPDGTVYNVVNGVAIADNDPFSVSYEEAGTADIVTSNYRIVDLSLIYDKSGSFVRSVNIYSLFEMPVTAVTDVTHWTIEDYVYVQYTYSLPDDAKKYDCYDASEGKLGIVTMRYDIKKDKVKEFKNFDYVVTNAFSTLTDLATGDEMRPTDYAVLLVSEINKDKQKSTPVVQTFKKNLGIYVNLQKLMPGATGISLYGGNVVLESYYTDEIAVFDGKDEIASFIPADSLTPVNGPPVNGGQAYRCGQAYRYGDSYYNFTGGHVYTLDSNEEALKTSANGVLWVADASSMTVKAINLANNSTTTYTEVGIIGSNMDYLSVANGSAVDVIDMNTGNVIISGISDTASISIPSQTDDYTLIRVTDNGINEFYRYGIVEKKA